MDDHRLYVSVMTPASSTGTLEFQIDSYDAATDVSIVATVTGVEAAMGEIDVAILIQAQLTDWLPAYSGTPTFSSDEAEATFRVTRTEHVVCIWSQARFRIQLTNNDGSGVAVRVSDVGLLMTYARAISLNSTLEGNSGFIVSGSLLSQAQTIDLIEMISAEAIAYLNNPIVISTYLGIWSTLDYKAIFTSPTPGLSMDAPVIKRKYYADTVSDYDYTKLAYTWIRSSGKLKFRYTQGLVDINEPFALDNEVLVTFTAGESTIPTALQRSLVQLANFGLVNSSGGVVELAGGTWRVKFGEFEKTLSRIFLPVRNLIARKMRP